MQSAVPVKIRHRPAVTLLVYNYFFLMSNMWKTATWWSDVTVLMITISKHSHFTFV
jgi:hypothetical protein